MSRTDSGHTVQIQHYRTLNWFDCCTLQTYSTNFTAITLKYDRTGRESVAAIYIILRAHNPEASPFMSQLPLAVGVRSPSRGPSQSASSLIPFRRCIMTLVGATQTSLKNHALASTLQAGWRVYFEWAPKRREGVLMNSDPRTKTMG